MPRPLPIELGGTGTNDGSNLGGSISSAALDTAFGSTQGGILTRTGAAWVLLPPGTAGYVLTSGGTGANILYAPGGAGKYQIGASWSGAGVAVYTPTDNVPGRAATTGTITSVTVLTQGGPGSCVIDIWKTPYSSYPPTVANTITAAAKPTISTGTKYTDSTLTGWTTSITAGDTFLFKLDSVSIFTLVSVYLQIQP